MHLTAALSNPEVKEGLGRLALSAWNAEVI
jgi:hypothetical protein